MKKIIYIVLTILLVACSEDKNTNTEDLNVDKNSGNINNVKNSTNTTEELKLYKLVMEYRKQHNLPSIPISKSLNIVAKTHVYDLHDNQPTGGNCNLHSWSNKGKWTPVCYTSDHKQAKGMWSKPKELTSYKGNGFEISHRSNPSPTAQSSLDSWKESSGHNDVILNKGNWNAKWNAIGMAIYKGNAVIWFGMKEDTN